MGTQQLLTDWTFDPLAMAFLAALLGSYLVAIGPLRRRFTLGEAVSARRIVAFVSGWLLLFVTVASPLDVIGREYLFTAHTIQLFSIITFVAPLLLTGVPEWLVRRLLLGHSLVEASGSLQFTMFAIGGFNALVLVWHAGNLYTQALHNMPLHDLENLCFLAAGLLTWWPLLTPADHRQRMTNLVQILYLTAESLPLDIFGVAALFIQRPFYPVYAAAPHIFGLSVLSDQQVAGAILAVPGNILDIVLMSVIFFQWIERMERSQRAQEAALYDAEDAAVLADVPVRAEVAVEGGEGD